MIADTEQGDRMTVLLLQIRTQVKMFHWQTKSYAEHEALDWLGGKLIELNDKWVEAYQGNEKTRVHCGENCSIKIVDWTPGAARVFIQDKVKSLRAKREAYWSTYQYTYLANIIDDIIGVLGKTLFLLTLH